MLVCAGDEIGKGVCLLGSASSTRVFETSVCFCVSEFVRVDEAVGEERRTRLKKSENITKV